MTGTHDTTDPNDTRSAVPFGPDSADRAAAATKAIADALNVPIANVSRSPYSSGFPTDLFTVTDPADPTQQWQFVHDTTAPRDTAWWLLGQCRGCGAIKVPVAAIATREDLNRYLARGTDVVELDRFHRDDGYCDCAIPETKIIDDASDDIDLSTLTDLGNMLNDAVREGSLLIEDGDLRAGDELVSTLHEVASRLDQFIADVENLVDDLERDLDANERWGCPVIPTAAQATSPSP